ncbi:MAG: glycosyltransferase, partial [Gemmatimonadales bacterium]
MPLTILDITKFYGETTGGIRTYLHQKAAYVNAHPGLRQVIVVPGERSGKRDEGQVRWYHVGGPRIPTQHPYRLLLNRRAIREIISLEQPDVIEIGSPYLVPWIVRGAARRRDIPLLLFFHTNFPRIIAPRAGTGALRGTASRLAWSYVARLGAAVDVVLAASEAAADDLKRAGVPRVRRVSLGVDLQHFHPRRREVPDVRQANGLPAGPVVM